ncbi:phosphoribosyltransferase [Patescibacteria group bacterium]
MVDTGYSLEALLEMLCARSALSVKTCALLSKPDRREVDVSVDYLGFKIANKWVEGYGLDTKQKGRGNPNIVIRGI